MHLNVHSRHSLFRTRLAMTVVMTCVQAAAVNAAEVEYPLSAVVAAEDVIYLADRNLPGIWKIQSGTAEVYVQASKKFGTPLNAIRCLALDAKGQLVAGDSATRDVYRIGADRKPVPLTQGKIGIPMAIIADAAGDLLVADLESHRVFRVPAAGGPPQEVVAVRAPRGLAVDAQGALHVLSTSSDKGQLLKWDGKQLTAVVAGHPFKFPHNVTFDKAGVAWVTDGYGKCVWRVADGQAVRSAAGPPLVNPVGITRDGDNLLIVDSRAPGLFRLNAKGELTTVMSFKSK